MKKHIKFIVFIISLIFVFAIYKSFSKQNSKYIYISLGDSIAEGMTPYGDVDYGYPDYIADYLKKENKLEFYTKKYAKSGYTTKDLINDINNNKVVTIDGKKYYLKELLRESDLVTLTIGANDIIKGAALKDISMMISDIPNFKKKLDGISLQVKEVIELIKEYAKNQIVVTGYFNPLPRQKEYKEEIDEVVKYYNYLIEEICEDLDVTYVDIFDILKKNPDVFSNPLDIHLSKKGYELVSNEIIKSLE